VLLALVDVLQQLREETSCERLGPVVVLGEPVPAFALLSVGDDELRNDHLIHDINFVLLTILLDHHPYPEPLSVAIAMYVRGASAF
jgi:hypothetical protein